jgi:hypothetical protein
MDVQVLDFRSPWCFVIQQDVSALVSYPTQLAQSGLNGSVGVGRTLRCGLVCPPDRSPCEDGRAGELDESHLDGGP